MVVIIGSSELSDEPMPIRSTLPAARAVRKVAAAGRARDEPISVLRESDMASLSE
jgi:hypothetical protein